MAKVCSLCNKEFKGATCPVCTETGVDVGKVLESEKAQMEKNEAASVPTAFLVDLVSNRKIPITTPRCRVGRDDLNDIVISGDQSISRFHFIITYDNGQYQVQDAKSRHGTFLNGNQIGGPEPINDGDVLKIGVSLFWFVIESPVGSEKEEALPPVDVEKAPGMEELSLKKGGDYAYSSETELSATQEISIVSPEALAQFGLTKKTEEEEAERRTEEKYAKEEVDEKKEAEPAVKADKDAEETESKSSKDEKKAKSDKGEDRDKHEEPAAEKDSTEQDEKPSAEDDNEPSPEADDKEEPADEVEDKDDENGESKDKDIEVAVKDLLEPLKDEIEASREMIRDALKKGELHSEQENKDEAEAQSDEEKEPAAATDEDKEDKEEEIEPAADTGDEDEKDESDSEHDDDEPETTAKKDKSTDEKSAEAETLEKIAEIIDDSSAKSELAEKGDEGPVVSDRIESLLASDHDKATNGLDEDMTTVTQMGPTTVPDWCKLYFSDELKHLNKELDALNEQIKQYQDKIRKIENQATLTKGIRNTLLTAEGDDLIEACKKVLALAGWKVTQSEEDKHEFLLEHEDEKVLIARVISIKGSAERSHLGQLSISQTRFWCEKGIEPKGVLIVGKISDKAPKDRGEETNTEVIEYANMKNVCIMNTLQMLALYRDVALKDGKGNEVRSSIHDSKGWLKGFDLEPGDEMTEDDDKEASKGKSLSSLLSA